MKRQENEANERSERHKHQTTQTGDKLKSKTNVKRQS
jgi:hypothetical protein